MAETDVTDDLAVHDGDPLGEQVLARTDLGPQVGDLVAVRGAIGAERCADDVEDRVGVGRPSGPDLEGVARSPAPR